MVECTAVVQVSYNKVGLMVKSSDVVSGKRAGDKTDLAQLIIAAVRELVNRFGAKVSSSGLSMRITHGQRYE